MTAERFSHINFIQLNLNYVITHVYISDLCFTLTWCTPLAICQASKSSTAGLFSDNAQAAWHVHNQCRGCRRRPARVAEQQERPTSVTHPYGVIIPRSTQMCAFLRVLSSSCLAAFDKLPGRNITVHFNCHGGPHTRLTPTCVNFHSIDDL